MPPRITNSFTNDINITNGDITITTPYTTTAAPTLNTIAWDVATNATTAWNQTYATINTVSADDFRDTVVNRWFNNATTTMVYQIDPDDVRIYPHSLTFPWEDSCEDWNTPELDSFIDSFAKNKSE